MKNNQNGPELLSPAGDMNCLRAAVKAGADAVYLSGSRFSARAHADNFSDESLLEAVDYAHLRGVKVYLAVNTLIKNREFEELSDYIYPHYVNGIDGIILQDIGAIRYIHTVFPGLHIHISTQAAVTNVRSALFFKEMGASRVVPSRELSLREILDIKRKAHVEVETFVHGSMCYSYSGLCLMSSVIGGRSGNRGRCAQPCRLPYQVGNSDYQTLMSMKDMCTLDVLPELIAGEIDSLKIEGRMKQADYVYIITSLYRKYRDIYLETPEKYRVEKEDRDMALGVYARRGYCGGYYHRKNGASMISFDSEKKHSSENVSAFIRGTDKLKVRVVVKFCVGEKMSLTLRSSLGGEDLSVTEYGDVVEKAKKTPFTQDQLKKRIEKSGDTPFLVEEIVTEVFGEGFLPVSRINQLRRQAFLRLEEHILAKGRRTDFERRFCDREQQIMNTWHSGHSREYVFTVQEQEQFALVDSQMSGAIISIDSENAESVLGKKSGRNLCFVSMPYIFRECDMGYYQKMLPVIRSFDGVFVRNWGTYFWLLESGFSGKMIADSNLYVFNQMSKKVMSDIGFFDFSCSQELNRAELGEMPGGGLFTVYGYQPVMVSANCIKKTMRECAGCSGFMTIKDRMNKKFHVKINCEICYNIIYNTDRLYLVDKLSEILPLQPSYLRADFTVEEAETCERVLGALQSGTELTRPEDLGITEYTRGHFYRGVK